MTLPTLAACEAAVGEPAAAWKGRCHEVALAIVKAGLCPPGTVTRYGAYWGPVHRDNGVFAGGLPFYRHGWIELPDGRVLDPTRWVFTAEAPYLFVTADAADYDPGMRRLWRATPPPPDGAHPNRYDLAFEDGDGDGELRAYLTATFGRDTQLNSEQLMWVANVPPAVLGPALARRYYAALRRTRTYFKAFVPIDAWVEIMEGGDYMGESFVA
jgi:hypothetical protein